MTPASGSPRGSPRARHRPRLRPRQRRDRRLRPGAGDRRDARHHVGLPRPRQLLDRRQADQRRPGAAGLARPHRLPPRRRAARGHHRRRDPRARRPSARPHRDRPAALRPRLQPRGRARSSASRRAASCSLAFGTAGLLAGFGGALWASRYATIDARVAYGYELTVIAAAVVGGVAIRGGAGTVAGIVLGGLDAPCHPQRAPPRAGRSALAPGRLRPRHPRRDRRRRLGQPPGRGAAALGAASVMTARVRRGPGSTPGTSCSPP